MDNGIGPEPNVVREKHSAALTSVIAAIGLTVIKVVIGVLTGSLGILSEAAHSGFDLAAALVTLMAVRVSDRPPDIRHQFGHGKVENLSALFETLLLLITSLLIIYEAIQRLFIKEVHVDASIWAFLVMGISVIVNITRAQVLRRTAKKHNSQALQADAIHFQTDIWSSLVVILGLVGVRVAEIFPRYAFFAKADAIAALGVSLIVIWVGFKLGRASVEALMDTAPQGLNQKIICAVEQIPGVINCHHVRIFPSGANLFIDAHVVLNDRLSLRDVHKILDRIEHEIRAIAPKAEVTVHPEPLSHIRDAELEQFEHPHIKDACDEVKDNGSDTKK
jgi:cation diffusion facilitator family transporter